jgi:parallel beta-helix repeat protein
MGLALDGVTPLATAGFQVLSVRDGNIIQGNRMAYSTSAGIWVDGAQTNTIRRNSIYANPFKGIFLDNAANNDLSAPIITLNASEGSGTACPNCTIELFLDASNQGRVYLDTLLSDASGHFQFPYYCPLAYTNLTATATDTYGNTSPFSEASSVPWNCSTARPAPSLSDISPDSQQAPAATVALQVSGAEFAPDSIVRWNGQNLPTSYLSPTALQTVIPSYLLQDGGSIPVSVFTPLPGGGESAPLVFTILPPWKIFLPLTRK